MKKKFVPAECCSLLSRDFGELLALLSVSIRDNRLRFRDRMFYNNNLVTLSYRAMTVLIVLSGDTSQDYFVSLQTSCKQEEI